MPAWAIARCWPDGVPATTRAQAADDYWLASRELATAG
jgi:hypothetical protein